MTEATYPRGLIADAQAHAERRAWREHAVIYVYARGGVVFVRAADEPAPDNAELIYRAPDPERNRT